MKFFFSQRGARSLCMVLVSLSCCLAFAGDENYQEVLAKAKASHSDALLIMEGEQTILNWRPEGQPERMIELMSALKSLVALGIGNLLQEGTLASLDTPVHEFFPEWRQGKKKQITVRHLLNHTSGLQNNLNAGIEIYPSPNALQLALAAELDSDPGEVFSYNNKAVNLLAGVIQKASGKRMDLFMQEVFFGPMEIKHYQWYFDASGQPHAMAGLRLYASDLAKFGRLVLKDGHWGEEQLVSPAFLKEMLAAGTHSYPGCGLLWWRLPREQRIELKAAALENRPEADPGVIAKLKTLSGKVFENSTHLRQTIREELGMGGRQQLLNTFGAGWMTELFTWEVSDIEAYYASGFLGQFLVVVPEADVVAVRQVAQKPTFNHQTDTFANFPRIIWEATKALKAPSEK